MSDDDFDDFELDDDTDLDDVPDSADPPPARYLVTIAKMEKKGRRDGKGNYINIQFKIADVLDESLEQFIGRSVFDIFNLGKDALWKIKGVIKACRGEDGAKGNRIPNMTDEQLVLDTFNDTYQGRVNLRTRGYASAEDWVGITMDLTASDDDSDGDDDASDASSNSGKSASGAQAAGEVEI